MSTPADVTLSHPVVARDEWITARKQLLAREKALTRQRDQLAAERRRLPWVRVETDYVFEGPRGQETLGDLFAGRSQLIVKHFMLGPGWEEGCVGCSFEADHLDSAVVHLEHHDVSLVAISRAPWTEVEPFQRRMGWRFPWVSACANTFNYDYHVSFSPEAVASGRAYYNYEVSEIPIEELSGLSTFYRNARGEIFHTYSVYSRGAEEVLSTYMLLDLTPMGRNENGPNRNLTDWVRHHDRYETGGRVDSTGRFRPTND